MQMSRNSRALKKANPTITTFTAIYIAEAGI
jgi:hypothetical protein